MPRNQSTAIAVVTGLALGAFFGLSAFFAWPMRLQSQALTAPNHPKFAEAKWPFPTDEWGEGKAFRCAAADCGVEVNVYIRPKIGFCNCLTGVSDDNELDWLSDFNLMGGKPAVLGAGHEIKVAWMKGRSRAYTVSEPYHAPSSCSPSPSMTIAMRLWRPRQWHTMRRKNLSPASSPSSTARSSCTGPK